MSRVAGEQLVAGMQPGDDWLLSCWPTGCSARASNS